MVREKKLMLCFFALFLLVLDFGGAFGQPILDAPPDPDPANISPPIRFDGCTPLVAGVHCGYNSDFPADNIQYEKRFDPPASVVSDGPNKGAFIAQIGATIVIDNFATFRNVCVNGAWGDGAHAVDLYVDGNKVADNGWSCIDRPSCFGGNICTASAANAISHTFLRLGLHRVKIVWDQQNNAQCGKAGEEFNVLVVNPIISINGSDDQIVIFRRNDTNKTGTIAWTITNTGPDRVLLKSITASGCGAGTGITCEFVGFRKLADVPAGARDTNALQPSLRQPRITIHAPRNGNYSLKSRTVRFDVNKGGFDIDLSSIKVDLNNARSVFSPTTHCIDFSGHKACKYDDESFVSELHSKLTVIARDVNGTEVTASSVFRFDPLGITIHEPNDGNFRVQARSVRFDVNRSLFSLDVLSIKVELDNSTSVFNPSFHCTDFAGHKACSFANENFLAGVNSKLTITAKDFSGKQVSASSSFKYVGIEPKITIHEPKDQNFSVTRRDVRFDVNKGSFDINLSSIRVDLNNSRSVFNPNIHCTDFAGHKACKYVSENLVAREHSRLTVSAGDANGNLVTASSVFRYDANGTITIHEPRHLDFRVRIKTVRFDVGRGGFDINLASITVNVNNSRSTIFNPSTHCTDVGGSKSCRYDNENFVEGQNAITITAKDVRDNQLAASNSFRFDLAGVTILEPKDGNLSVRNRTVRFDVNTSSFFPEFSRIIVDLNNASSVFNASAHCTDFFGQKACKYDNESFVAGVHSELTVGAEDPRGNRRSASSVFRYDTSISPAVATTLPASTVYLANGPSVVVFVPTIRISVPRNLDFNVATKRVRFEVAKASPGADIDVSSVRVDMNNATSSFNRTAHCTVLNKDNVRCDYTENAIPSNVHTRLTVTVKDTANNPSTASTIFRLVSDANAPRDSPAPRDAPRDGNDAIGPLGPSARIDLIIAQGESLVITEKLNLSRPGSVPASSIFSVRVSFSDVGGASTKDRFSNDTVKLTRLLADKQQFNVELIGGDQGFCIGRDGRLGSTGPTAVPRVLLSWDWRDIEFDSCSPKNQLDNTPAFCDPTQFSIALLKRLDKIHSLAKQGKVSEASSLTKYRAFLLQDSINEDFRKDFDYYYTQAGFFNAAAFYEDPETPWNLYFTDSSRLKFNPTNISAGLYDVDISIDSEAGPLSFFGASKPSARIEVKLEKLREPDALNPFYLLPFNGSVGLFGQDADGRVERKGYGLRFSGSSIPVTPEVSTASASGEKTVAVETIDNFKTLNVTKRESVLSVSSGAAELKFAPSYATPVAMAILSQNDRAEAFYYLLKNNQPVAVPGDFGTFWTGFGSTPMQCKNFDNTTIFYRKNDSRAVAGTCADLGLGFDQFGFRFTNVPQENRSGRMFLETIFYTPLNADTRLRNACAQTPAIFASPSQEPSSGSMSLELKHKRSGASIKEMFEKIASRDLCASIEQGTFEVWWNPQRVSADLNAAREKLIKQSPTPVICRLPPEVALLPAE